MRLAIFTLPLHTNYGGLLQAYALQTVLQRLGHQAVVLRKKEFSLGLNIPPSRIINRLKQRFIDKEDCYILYERKMKQLAPVIRQHTERFVSQHINSYWLWRLNSLRESDFDGYVVGSDQVWRPVFFRNIGNVFLDFTAHWNVRRVAYAASFGTDSREYTDAQVRLCRDAIARFDGVSVREESGMELCRQYFGVEAEWVLDPTMLLLPTDYEQIVRQSVVPQSPGNLFCYTLDDSPLLQQTINSIASLSLNTQHSTLNAQPHLQPFYINAFSGNKRVDIAQRIQPPVESWLRAFIDAHYVVTDSFHATVFSILFHKPFVVCINNGRGVARLRSLLAIFGLENRLIENVAQLQHLNEPIDWEETDRRLEYWREKSIGFLVRLFAEAQPHSSR